MQFGFKRGTGTAEATFVLRTFLLYSTRVLNRFAYTCFVDIRKAFPSTSRSKIFEVFRRFGVPPKLNRALASLLSFSSSKLRINGHLTPPFLVTSGTPEGSIISPESFSILFRAVLEGIGIEELPENWEDIVPGKVYYIAFADDLALFSLDISALERGVRELKVACRQYDVNDGKTKWMAFPPSFETHASVDVELSDMELVVDGVAVEQVDEFHYLGFRLDSQLSDERHVKLINERYLKAARAIGMTLRDLKCTNPFTLKRFFTQLVFSQLYGAIFVGDEGIEFEKGVGVFFRTAMGLADNFPSVVALACLKVKHLSTFLLEQRTKFLLKVESKPCSVVYSALIIDRCELFRLGVGLNARYGDVLERINILRTIDYTVHYQGIWQALAGTLSSEHLGGALRAEGRAFWVEVFPRGFFPEELVQALGRIQGDSARIMLKLLANTLHWTVLKAPTLKCSICSQRFSTCHFFSCNRSFLLGRDWAIFMGLAKAESWTSLIDFVFDILRRWVENTELFKVQFRLSIFEFEPFGSPDPFRWLL